MREVTELRELMEPASPGGRLGRQDTRVRMIFPQSIPGDEDGLVVLPLGDGAELHGVFRLDVQVQLRQRDLDLPDAEILAAVIHLEHDGLLPHESRSRLK